VIFQSPEWLLLEVSVKFKSQIDRREIDRRSLLIGGAGLVGGLALAACSSSAGSSATTAATSGTGSTSGALPALSETALIAQSKKESGSVIWYAGGAPQAEPLITAGFHRKYPWATLKPVDMTQEARPQKLLVEHATHAPTADVTSGSPSFFTELVPQGIVQAVALEAEKSIPATYLDSEHYMHPWYDLPVSPVYNTNLVKTPPTDPYQLADPSWSGKLAFDNPESRGQAYIWLLAWQIEWGTTKWTKWLDGLTANKPILTGSSSGNTYNDVLQGSRELGPDGPNDVGTQKPGTPVKQMYDTPGFSPVPDVVSLWMVANSPRPATTQLFLNYMLGAEAERIMAEGFRPPLLPGLGTQCDLDKLFGPGVAEFPYGKLLPLLKNPNGLDKVIDAHFPV
jgi:ABC-type Fe3+ transport system substrate-binding protein